jgi:hypothetical protein
VTADHLGDHQGCPEFAAEVAKGEVGISGQRGKDKGRVESQVGDLKHIFTADIFLQTEYIRNFNFFTLYSCIFVPVSFSITVICMTVVQTG